MPNYVLDANDVLVCKCDLEAEADLIVRAVNAHDALVEALEAMVDNLVQLADSGDAGFWDAEDQECVKQARAALALARGQTQVDEEADQ